jgi:hypothetical protein
LFEQARERFNSSDATSPPTSTCAQDEEEKATTPTTRPRRRSTGKGIAKMTLADDETYPSEAASECCMLGESSEKEF